LKCKDGLHFKILGSGRIQRDFRSFAIGLAAGNATAKESSATGKAMAKEGAQKLDMISPTYETSPQYLEKYPASDRAKAIMQKGTVIDTLFSAVYPGQWKNDDQFHPQSFCMALSP
jgi:hypothetical protein